MYVATLLDLARERAGIPSDYRLAKMLGVATQRISNWRHDLAWPTLPQAFQLAEWAQLNPAQVIAEIERDRAERQGKADTARTWREWAEKLGGIAAAVIVSVTALAGGTGANPASARVSGEHGGSSPSVDTRYTLCSKRRRKAARARSTIADAAAVALAALSPRRHASA